MSKRGRNSPKKIVFASTRLRNNKKSPSTEVERPLIFLHVFFILTDSEKILGKHAFALTGYSLQEPYPNSCACNYNIFV